jgi:glutathione synthase/RimK-type ligase-like ATP-grasp enzyme
MRLAIHGTPGSFSERWIELCRERGIDHEIVDCFHDGIIPQLLRCDALLWHWRHDDARAVQAARQIILSVEAAGLVVFPNSATCWHFDDKVGQKYLLEAKRAPLVPTHVFYDRETAMQWIADAKFPKVFKLTTGASSSNVRLVESRSQAEALCDQAFGEGFVSAPTYFADAKRKLGSIDSAAAFLGKLRRAPQSIRRSHRTRRSLHRQRGYIYFQDFVPDNDHDTRVTVIGNRAFGFTRGVRDGDFRASGSGRLDLDPAGVDRRCVEIAFDVAGRIGAQSLAFDFVVDPEGNPLIVEISYGYLAGVVHDCPGHWDREGNWHEGQVWPQDAILDDLLNSMDAGKPRAARHDPART